MRSFLILLIVAGIGPFALLAQNPGYLGKHNAVEFFLQGQMPATANFLIDNDDYAYDFGSEIGVLDGKKDRFDWGWNAGFVHGFSSKFALGMEFGQSNFSIIAPFFRIDNAFVDGQFGRVPVKSTIFMPKLEFSSKNGLIPIGLIHQIGFGIRRMKLKDRPLEYKNLNIYGFPLTTSEQAQIDNYAMDYSRKYKGFSLMYSIMARTPLSPNFLITYGIRYLLNINISNTLSDVYEPPYLSAPSEIEERMRKRNLYSVIWLNFGTAFVF